MIREIKQEQRVGCTEEAEEKSKKVIYIFYDVLYACLPQAGAML
jgi:hypothetical protein